MEPKTTDYDKELSVGTYAGKKIYETVVSLGSTALGAWGGLVAAAKMMKPAEEEAVNEAIPIVRKLPGLGAGLTQRQLMWGGFGGAFAGTLVGGLVLGYEHWIKVKREQMQVDEITKDISDIEVFKKTDPELAAENKRLWAELAKRDAHGAHAPRHGSVEAEERHEAENHASNHEKRGHHAKKEERGDSWQDAVQSSQEHAEHQEAAR